jgi:hypothetical protein
MPKRADPGLAIKAACTSRPTTSAWPLHDNTFWFARSGGNLSEVRRSYRAYHDLVHRGIGRDAIPAARSFHSNLIVSPEDKHVAVNIDQSSLIINRGNLQLFRRNLLRDGVCAI